MTKPECLNVRNTEKAAVDVVTAVRVSNGAIYG